MNKLFILLLSLYVNITFTQDYQLADQYRDEIKQLAGNPVIQASFDYIRSLEDQTQSDHVALTEIEAPPFKEEKRAKIFRDMLAAIGADTIWIDEVGNVLALIKGTEGNRTVCLDAHLDTVFPEGTDVHVKIKNDTLYAPGIGDDTRGLAMLLTIIKTLHAQKIKMQDDVLIIASVGEEGLGDLRELSDQHGRGILPDGDGDEDADQGRTTRRCEVV